MKQTTAPLTEEQKKKLGDAYSREIQQREANMRDEIKERREIQQKEADEEAERARALRQMMNEKGAPVIDEDERLSAFGRSPEEVVMEGEKRSYGEMKK